MDTFVFSEDRLAGTTPSIDGQSGPAAPPQTLPAGPARVHDPDFPEDLSVVSTSLLRILCNRTYRVLDRDFAPMEAVQHYSELVIEIERRELQAERPASPDRARSVFRDNLLFSRFELFSDGTMVGHVRYELKGSHAVLIQAVVNPRFDAMGVETALIRQVLLNAHRRRIAVVPYCSRVRGFLAEFPQYGALLRPDERRRLETPRAVGVGDQLTSMDGSVTR